MTTDSKARVRERKLNCAVEGITISHERRAREYTLLECAQYPRVNATRQS